MSNEQKPVLSFFQRRAFLLSALGGGLAGLVGAIALPEGWLIAAPAGKAGDGGTTSGKSEAFYACPMFCTRLDKPGTCPVCGMDLERFVDTGAMLELTERERMAMGVKSAPVQRLQLAREIRTLGQFEPDESLDRVVSAWVAGRIDRLYADFTGVTVSEGDHLFDLYSPELYVAHRELKVAQQSLANKTPGADRLVELSREKLRRLGLSAAQLTELEAREATAATFTVPSPASGVVLEKMAREGQYVEMGMPIYRITDLSRLWLMLNVHERDLPFVSLGQRVDVEVSGLRGHHFEGAVSFIDPVLDTMTRTARVRVEVPNVQGLLKPGLFGAATLFAELASDGTLATPSLPGEYACPMHPLQRAEAPGRCRICGMELKKRVPAKGKAAGKVLAVPREAVLSTGKRTLVYVEWWAEREPDGSIRHDHAGNARRLAQPQYQGFEVHLGPLCSAFHRKEDGTLHKLGDYYPVIEGLPTGVRIVTHGQFLIDSQQELSGKPSLFRPQGGSTDGGHSGH